jgi:Xaa-Pro dipeptidase
VVHASASAPTTLVTPSGARLASRPDPTPDHKAFREAVLRSLPTGNLVYVPGGVAQTRNGIEGNARFRQEPNFLYLTGITEPGYHALFGCGADAPYVLIAPRQPKDMDVWCGAQPTCDELRKTYGADIACACCISQIQTRFDAAYGVRLAGTTHYPPFQ